MSGKNWIKAMIATLLGLLVTTIGLDPISGSERFTFGNSGMLGGIPLIPTLIGLFALSEVFMSLQENEKIRQVVQDISDRYPKIKEILPYKFAFLRSSFLLGSFRGLERRLPVLYLIMRRKELQKNQRHLGRVILRGSLLRRLQILRWLGAH